VSQSSTKPAAWPSGLLIVDKPGGMTSHDVVARVRRLAHTRRVGHAGTLDPMATGVLVLGIEKATRLLGHLMLTEKTYEATICLGRSTTTDDAEGEPTGGSSAAGVSEAALNAEIAKLTGDILQVPSSVSAIKVNGQRAYKLTRAGEAPELAARPVTVYEFLVLGISRTGDFLAVDARVRCSSGTYIRALARDLGAALGTGGHLTALRRTAVGPYTLAQARTLENLEEQSQSQSSERLLVSPGPHASLRGVADEEAADEEAAAVIPLAQAAAAAFPRLRLSADEARRLAQGARLPLPRAGDLLPPRPSTADRSGAVPPVANPSSPVAPSSELTRAVPPGTEPMGAGGPSATTDLAPGAPAASYPDTPIAAFAPDGTLVALVAAEQDRLRSLAVFAGA
jgi:tRNA pseudouridine55 synthase